MIASIVNEAISTAINRDLENKSAKPSGVTMDDLHGSIMKSFKQNSRMNHQHHFEDLSYELQTESNDKIKDITPLKIQEPVAEVKKEDKKKLEPVS